MKIGNNGNLVLGPFDESTPCLMIVLMNCQTKLKINHLTAVKSVAILESNANLNFYTWEKNTLYIYKERRKGKNAVQARKKLTDVYGEGVLTVVRHCQNWFAKFRSGNFDVEDAPRSGKPDEADKDAIKALVDANRRITTREIKLRLNLSNSTVYDHLKGLGLSSKLNVWVPHVLTE
ncbi:histone-lysine N-methyltransferase SETMAR [Trichonephila clavipes]|nr:histone-lysine N-methyltransferase SETMAR [Trichonephila clavipes]